MPCPHHPRPDDVVRALNGKVVEIQNTDAEGRLNLGDAMVWAERHGATHLVDVATLTGAVERALGKQITGGFGKDTITAGAGNHIVAGDNAQVDYDTLTFNGKVVKEAA